MTSFLVIGATGRQGGSTARELLKAGAKVHALVRNPQSSVAKEIEALGATLFKGDASDAQAITTALEGVSGVFFNPPYPGPDTLQTTQTFIQTCAAQPNVKTFVLSSTAGTEKHAEMLRSDPTYLERQKKFSGYWNLKIGTEEAARKAGFENLIIMRAPLLYHIYLPGDAEALFPDLWSKKTFITALKPETKVPHLQAEDVGKFAAKALLEPSHFQGKAINLAAQNLTAQVVADIIGKTFGTKIEVPVAEFDGVEAVGLKYPLAGYHEWCNEIDASVDVAALDQYGVHRTTMQDFLQEHGEDIKRALSS